MNRIFKKVMVLSMASLAILSSCSKDETTIADATITITPSPTGSLMLGQVLTLTIEGTGNADNKLSEITVTRSGRNTPIIDNEKISGTSVQKIVRDTPTTAGTYVYTVTLKANKGTVTNSYTVAVNAQVSYTSLTPSGTLSLGAQSSTVAQFVNLQTLTTHEFGNGDAKSNSASVDIGAAYGTTNGASLFAPSNTTFDGIYSGTHGITSWVTRNATKLVKTNNISVAQFNAATNDSIIIANANGWLTATTLVNNLAVNDVVLFQTARAAGTNKTGMILITAITPNTTGGIDVKYKVQQ